MPQGSIAESFREIRDSLPDGVRLVVAAKGRKGREIREAIEAGAREVGENYVQDAERHRLELGEATEQVEWHLIGHLQRNKINRALPLFSMLQSLDSLRLARAIDKRTEEPIPALIEVNIAGEESKYGIPVDEVAQLAPRLAELDGVRVRGLMTMEPYMEDPEGARPYFRRMRELFGELKGRGLPGLEMEVLSMGMTNSWRVAVEEGSNMVRIGTAIFGPRT